MLGHRPGIAGEAGAVDVPLHTGPRIAGWQEVGHVYSKEWSADIGVLYQFNTPRNMLTARLVAAAEVRFMLAPPLPSDTTSRIVRDFNTKAA